MKLHVLLFTIMAATCCAASAQTLEGSSPVIEIDVTNAITMTGQEELALTLESLGMTKLPKYHALILGVSEYQNSGPGLPNLDMPAKDAEHLYNLLVQKYSFEPSDVTLLTNPTREDIINQFDRLAETVTDRDNLLIFYAGHGFYDKAKDFGFWLPADAKINSRSAWIANSTIKDYISAIKSKHTLLITDACFGGSIFKTRSVDAVLTRFHEVYKDASRKAITSGNLTEVPDNSVFLKFLLKNLEDNKDVFLSTSSLFARIYQPILDNAATTPQFGVIQGSGDAGGDFVFIKKN